MRYVEDWNSFNIAQDVLKGDRKTLKLQYEGGVFSLVCEWECPLRPVRAVVASWADNPLRPTVEVLRDANQRAQRRAAWRRFFGEQP